MNCEECDNCKATHHCINCDLHMCEEMHITRARNRNHRVISLHTDERSTATTRLQQLDKQIIITSNKLDNIIYLILNDDVHKDKLPYAIKLSKNLKELTREKIQLITHTEEIEKLQTFLSNISERIRNMESILKEPSGMFKAKKFTINKKVISDPRNILHYLSEKGIYKKSNPKDIIKTAKLWLDDDNFISK